MHFYFDGVIIKASAKENQIDDRKRKNKKIMSESEETDDYLNTLPAEISAEHLKTNRSFLGIPSGLGTENRGTAAGRTGASDDAGFGKLDIKGPLAFCHFAG